LRLKGDFRAKIFLHALVECFVTRNVLEMLETLLKNYGEAQREERDAYPKFIKV